MYTEKRFSIKTWAEDDRPREKLVLKGRPSLSDAELIAILIGSGNREESAVELSKRMLLSAGGLEKLAKYSINDLKNFKGMGEAKAISVIAAFELGRRKNCLMAEEEDTMKIRASADGHRIIRPELDDLQHEEFWVLMLNRANVVVKKEQISR